MSSFMKSSPFESVNVPKSTPLSQSILSEQHFSDTYSIQDSYTSARLDFAFSDSEQKSTFLSSPGGGQYAVINHDVNEISEPHSDDTRFVYSLAWLYCTLYHVTY